MYNTQMLKGILDWCVLSIINKEKVYSQEILIRLKEFGFSEMSDGTLFPLMLRLEKEGLVDSEKKDNPLGASRKYYTLNSKGEKALRDFIKEWRDFKNVVDAVLGDRD